MSQENQNIQEEPHKRRVRYKGKYPRNYKEKYKELNPEKYQDTIEKVIRKGSTPAGMHISIMVREIIDFLQIKPGQTGFDATLGYGGHTKAMLECLKGQGHMYATDVDPIESAKTKKRLADAGFGEDILTIRLYGVIRHSIFLRWLLDGQKEIAYETVRDYIVIICRMTGYDEEDIYEYLENSFEELVWDWGYLALIIG